MGDVELLPLPDPVEYVFAGHDTAEGYEMATAGKPYYTPSQMRSYARANLAPLQAENERLNRLLGRIVEGDGDSTLTIRAGADAFAAAREYLAAPKPQAVEIEALQAEIEALRAEVGELHMHAKRRDQYTVEKAAQALDWKKRAERLAEALRGMLDVAEESFANRTYVPINCPQVAKAHAELAQEDRNG